MKKIMILGASATQVPLIKCAKDMGLKTYVVSIPGNYPGFQLADVPIYLDTTDKNAIFAVAKREGIDGICTTGTDVAVKSIGFVCSSMALNGISEESAELVTDKAKMKEAMRIGNVRTAPFSICYSLTEVQKAAKELGYPVMVKTVDQAASKGISKVDSEDGINDAYLNSMKWTKKEYVVVEQCLVGDEVGLDGYVDGGGKCVIFVHNKMIYNNGKTNVPIGHSMPFKDDSLKYSIEEIGRLCVRAMGLRNSFFNMDIMICGGVPYVIEVGGRTGSTCIPEMISVFTGENYYIKIIENALSKPISFDSSLSTPCAAGFLMAVKNGVIKEIDVEKLNTFPNVQYELDVKRGDIVRKFCLGSDRIGCVLCSGKNLVEAESSFEYFQKEFNECIKYE